MMNRIGGSGMELFFF